MSAPCPPSRPRASLTQVLFKAAEAWCAAHEGAVLPKTFVLAVRGYYRDTMGEPGVNDVGMYDDAFFIVSPAGFTAWNGNTDPSRLGWNPNADGYMARLKPGCWTMERRMHRGKYLAFGQGEHPVTIERVKADGTVAKTVTGCYGINLHHGGFHGTSSEGCQTVPLAQWTAFDETLAMVVRALGKNEFPFILVEGPVN